MIYRLELSRKAQKSIDSLPLDFQKKILKVLQSLSEDPHLGKRLQGDLRGFWSIRAWPYRIVYEIFEKEVLVLVVNVGHRKDIYR